MAPTESSTICQSSWQPRVARGESFPKCPQESCCPLAPPTLSQAGVHNCTGGLSQRGLSLSLRSHPRAGSSAPGSQESTETSCWHRPVGGDPLQDEPPFTGMLDGASPAPSNLSEGGGLARVSFGRFFPSPALSGLDEEGERTPSVCLFFLQHGGSRSGQMPFSTIFFFTQV